MAEAKELEAMRLLLDLLADKWTVPVLAALCAGGGRQRFNAIRREVSAISQKSLATCLRRLEANGLVERYVVTSGELAVEYRVTSLGHTLEEPFGALMAWSGEHSGAVQEARAAYAAKLDPECEDRMGCDSAMAQQALAAA
ncbi:winged helix-turn-helix transcriptional regulator [Sphingobium yanoikuyae]|uniref:MarR family transcriptional regulator n=1 Tax=Sphingobium yanoikuyae TaxID=13690 RepID=A0A291MY38_SPHYA|nr:helix-turn-helix domain-containing protein [Sphingobium yanoikuyae]ATI80033.1 MarR family transcriptional regulator [Sphingobium yanoikuyae]